MHGNILKPLSKTQVQLTKSEKYKGERREGGVCHKLYICLKECPVYVTQYDATRVETCFERLRLLISSIYI